MKTYLVLFCLMINDTVFAGICYVNPLVEIDCKLDKTQASHSSSACFKYYYRLPETLMVASGQVQDTFKEKNESGLFYTGANCFWFSLSYHFERFAYFARQIFHEEFVSNTGAFVRYELSQVVPQKGDLIVIEKSYRQCQRVIKDEFGRKFETVCQDFSGPVHAAVSLGKNIVVQKENPMDGSISIDTIENVINEYVLFPQTTGISRVKYQSYLLRRNP